MIINKSKSLDSQCDDGDLILISQICEYRTTWKGIRKNLSYFSNTYWRNLYVFILNEYAISLTDINKYKLKAKGQFISLEALIPFDGFSDVIEVIEIQGRCLRVRSKVVGNECQSSNLDVHIGIEM